MYAKTRKGLGGTRVNKSRVSFPKNTRKCPFVTKARNTKEAFINSFPMADMKT